MKYGRVADGTRCQKDPSVFDVCIEGSCKVKLFVVDILRLRHSTVHVKQVNNE